MAKAKKQSKKRTTDPAKLERYLTIVLLVAFVVSAGILITRNNSNSRAGVGEPAAVIESK